MASESNVLEAHVEPENLSQLTPAEFYASSKHQAVRKLLGFSPEPSVLPHPRVWPENDAANRLRGIMREFADQDTSDVKDADRAREREHEERKFGSFPSR